MSTKPAIHVRTARDSLRWIGKDVLLRLLPFAIAAVFWAYVFADGAETLKISLDFTLLDAILILGTGIPAFVVCTLFHARYWPIYSLASRRAHFIEDGYFLFFNAPAEELFFRGMLQTWLMSLGFIHPAVGFVAVAAVFGFYHRLARFTLPFLLLATAGGFLFGVLFLISGTILTPIIVHFAANLALFNLGPALLVRIGKIPHRPVTARPV